MSITTPSEANVFGAPFVEILEYPIDREAAVSVSANLCRRHKLLPIGRDGGTLIVAMADPNDILALDDVSAATRMRIRPVLVDAKDLATTIDRYHRADDELSDIQHELFDQGAAGEESAVVEDDDAPIVRFVNLLISQAIQDRASDIHIEPGEHELRVRYRIDGVLKEVQSAPVSVQAGVHLPPEGHVRPGHRGAPQAAGRPHLGDAPGPQDRPPRRDPADRVRREDRHADPRHVGLGEEHRRTSR